MDSDVQHSPVMELRPHQLDALRKLTNGKILWGGVGSGKTLVAAEYYKLREAPRDVYVITTAKKRNDRDWQHQFYELNIGPKERAGDSLGRFHQVAAVGAVCSEATVGQSGNDGLPENLASSQRVSDHNQHREMVGGTSDRELGMDEPSGSLSRAGEAGDRAGISGSTYPYVLTVDSWNNLGKYAGVEGAFFIFDEQRLVGSGEWTKAFLRISRRNHWILLSATPGDTWMDYVPIFIANGFYKNRTEFKREHVVYNTFTKFPKVDRYINQGRLIRQRAQLLVEMPFERHTTRHYVEVPLEFDKDAVLRVLQQRWHVFEERPLRDVAEMCAVSRKVVNGDASRLKMVKELWKIHPKLIVFYNFNYELEALRSLASSLPSAKTVTGTKTKMAVSGNGNSTSTPISIDGSNKMSTSSDPCITPESSSSLTGCRGSSASTAGAENMSIVPVGSVRIAEWNGHKHEAVPKTDRWLYLVQYTAGAEGWNCIETDAMIMYSRNYSWKITEQAYGRIDRLNTPFKDLWYYDFTTDSWIDRAIGRSLKAKETFNEMKYKRLFEG